MNFIAALILLYEQDETMAWTIFVKVLTKDNWRQLFLYQTPKLFELSGDIKKFISKELPKLSAILKKYNVVLESLLASVFMTLFSNLVSIEHSSRILDRFILSKYTINSDNLFIAG